MPVKKHRRVGLRGTESASGGIVGRGAFGDTYHPTVGTAEGYGDAAGDSGGYGSEEWGYGDPYSVEGWYIIEVLEEGLVKSFVAGIDPSGVGSNWVRENGGEFVVVGSTSPIGDGPYRVTVRPTGGSRTREAYSGVMGQGTTIDPDQDNDRFAFVAPYAYELGPADVIIDRPGGQIIAEALIRYVPYSNRSGTKLLRSLWPDIFDKGSYDPTVTE